MEDCTLARQIDCGKCTMGMGGGKVDSTKRVTKKKSTSRCEVDKQAVRESELPCAVEKPTRTRDRNICRAVLSEYIICENN